MNAPPSRPGAYRTFKKHGIYALIYTDTQLASIETVFADMKKHLAPENKVVQLDFDLLQEFFK